MLPFEPKLRYFLFFLRSSKKTHAHASGRLVVFVTSDSALIISVKDDGTPYDDNFIAGYGIQSVYEKLDLLFPGKDHIELGTGSEKVFKISLNR